MLGRFLPKKTSFFEYFEKHSSLCVQACRELLNLSKGETEVSKAAAIIKDLERQADLVTHQCTDDLHRTFITPIDRTEIHSLIKRMDDVIDSIDATTSRFVLYEIKEVKPEFQKMAEVLLNASTAIQEAVHLLRNMKNATEIEQACIRIHHLENEGDELLRSALGRLFSEETNAVLIIKWKELYERLEKTSDRCESVANIIQTVVIEAT